MNLYKLTEYNFFGHPEKREIQAFEKWVSGNHNLNIAQVKPPQIYYEYLKSVFDVFNSFGQDFGFDFSNRLPNVAQIVLLSPEDFTKIIGNRNYEAEKTAAYTEGVSKNIYLKWSSDRAIFDTLTTIQHELIHSISSHNVYVNPETHKFKVSLGFTIPPESKEKLFTEAVTEIVNGIIIKNYWPKYQNLLKIIPQKYSLTYKGPIAKIESSIKQLVGSSNKTEKEIYNELIRGIIIGDTSFFSRYPVFLNCLN